MKKIVLILLMSLLSIAFADTVPDTATITLNATVKGVHEIGVFNAAVAGTGALTTGITAVDIGDIDPSRTSDIVTAYKYLAVRTNQKAETTVTIAINPLIYIDPLSDDTDVLAYNMVFDTSIPETEGNEALTKTVSTTAGSRTLKIPAGNGVRVYNFPFRFTVTTAQFTAAVPAAYSATIAFTYAAP